MADAHCHALGIPEHLHESGRGPVPFEDPTERLFRRFVLTSGEDLTACINFSEMSVNRSACSTADETLINDEQGGRYEGCGVVEFPVAALGGVYPTGDAGQETIYTLRPEHKPKQCNYAHSEVIAQKNGEAQKRIKPPSVKLAMRRALREHVKVCLPPERAGEQLPLAE